MAVPGPGLVRPEPGSAWGEDAELVAFGVGEDGPGDVALADVDGGGSQGAEAIDLAGLVVVGKWGDVDVDAEFGRLGLVDAVEVEVGAAGCGVAEPDAVVVVAEDEPAGRCGPEGGDGFGVGAVEDDGGYRADAPEGGGGVLADRAGVADDAELVAFGVGHHDPRDVGRLADVDLPGAQPFEAGDECKLVLGGRRRQVEVDAVLRGLWVGTEPKDEGELALLGRVVLGWRDDDFVWAAQKRARADGSAASITRLSRRVGIPTVYRLSDPLRRTSALALCCSSGRPTDPRRRDLDHGCASPGVAESPKIAHRHVVWRAMLASNPAGGYHRRPDDPPSRGVVLLLGLSGRRFVAPARMPGIS